jgi:hypothetical protein
VPTDWITNVTVTMYRNNGNKLQGHSDTGISLLCTGYKILTTYLNNRLKQYADHKTGEYQAGFRARKSTEDQTFTVRKAREYGVEIYRVFPDFSECPRQYVKG